LAAAVDPGVLDARDLVDRGPVVAVSVLRPGDEDLHHGDGSHRWMCPFPNAAEAVESTWSKRMHAHRDEHRQGMDGGGQVRVEAAHGGVGGWSSAATEHVPARPLWTCAVCPGPWPCPTRRRQLLAEYAAAPAALGVYLALCLADAADDLVGVPAEQLYTRFLGWGAPGRIIVIERDAHDRGC